MTAVGGPAVGGELLLDVQLLDPRKLTAHPLNVRADLGDLSGLTDSIREQGVIEPLIVVPTADGHAIVAGHRRAAAAIAAELERVPCIVRGDLKLLHATDDARTAEHVGAMLSENLHREGLTAMEEARGVKQMLDLGMPISKVAKRTGLGQKRVKKAIGVARLDDDTAAAVDAGQLDLDSAAAIALYADEPEVTARLVASAERGPGQLAHALEQEKQSRKARAAYEARLAEVRDSGRVVITSSDAISWTSLSQLSHDGEPMWGKEEEHRSCPGSAVHISLRWDGPYETEVCTDPAANGHVDRWASERSKAKPETEEEKEAAKAERRLVIANNKAMQAANVVRREWLRSFLQQRTAPKELLRFVAETFAIPRIMDGWLSGLSSGGDHDAHKALGLEKPSYQVQRDTTLTTGEQVPDGRLPLQLFAHVAAAHELSISRESWRPNTTIGTANVARWLRFLAGRGYTLSDVEQLIVDGAGR